MSDVYGFGGQLLEGAAVTLEVAFLSLAFGVALGIAGAAAKLSRRPWMRGPATLLIDLVRGVPEFLILLIVYFSLPGVLSGLVGTDVAVGPLAGGVFALSIVFGAYASETFRGGFAAVPEGQLEAARAFGLSRLQVFARIHLPQAWRIALPGLSNLWQTLLKDTSLVSVLGLEEIMRKADIAAQVTKKPFDFYVAAALIYLDLDGLKRINDAHGHAAGDAALAAVAATLVDEVRESDVVGRMGGDEFAVLLARAPPAEAQGKAASLARVVADAPLVFEGQTIPLAVSTGVRPLDPELTAAELIAQADAAMYLAKGAREPG